MRRRMTFFCSARAAALISPSRSGNSSASSARDGGHGLVGGGVALGLGGDLRRLGQTLGAQGLDAGEHVVPVVELRLPFEGRDQVGALGGVDELALQLDRLADPRLGGFEPASDHLFGDIGRPVLVELPGTLGATGLDHHDGDVAVVELATRDHQVEGGVLALLVGGVRHPAALRRPGDAHGADGPLERDARHHQRSRGAVDGQHVVGVVPIDAHDRHHDLGLVPVAVGEAGPQRPVDQPTGEDGQVGGPALPAEEAAGDPPGGVHALLDVDRQGEEIDALAHAVRGVGGDQHLRLTQGGDHCALALERDLAGLECQ